MPEPVEEVADVPVRRRPPRPPSFREQRALTAQRVRDEFAKSGTLPSTFRQMLVDEVSTVRWAEGRPVSRQMVEDFIDRWAADLLAKHDKETAT